MSPSTLFDRAGFEPFTLQTIASVQSSSLILIEPSKKQVRQADLHHGSDYIPAFEVAGRPTPVFPNWSSTSSNGGVGENGFETM